MKQKAKTNLSRDSYKGNNNNKNYNIVQEKPEYFYIICAVDKEKSLQGLLACNTEFFCKTFKAFRYGVGNDFINLRACKKTFKLLFPNVVICFDLLKINRN